MVTTDIPESAASKADRLRALHRPGRPLILVNVWDVAGARVVAAHGATAIATASYAMSASFGRSDGEGLDLEENLGVVGRIAAAVGLPVSADLERGYGRTPDDVAASVTRLLATGAVGCNIEDSLVSLGGPGDGSGIRPVEDQVERLRAARQAGARAEVPLVINARTDVLARGGEVDDAVRRGLAYLDAGADCVFVLGVTDLTDIRRLVTAFRGRLNILGRPGMPSIPDLAAAGVCRISIGSSGIGITHAALSRAAAQLLDGGAYLPNQGFALPTGGRPAAPPTGG